MTPPTQLRNCLRPLLIFSKDLLILLLVVSSLGSPLRGQQGGGVAPSGPQVHLIRFVVGAKGEQRDGSFVMTEPRSVFYIPEDREVIVYFEWEGAKGSHHCEGMVKGPSGQFATMTSFEYNATQPRFAGYWKMPLSDSTPTGNWIFESHVDGEMAGQATFQVVSNTKPADLPKAPVLPTAAQIYKQGVAASVSIEKLDATGKSLRRASGFLTPLGVVTSFRAIEGANNLALRFSDGKEFRTDRILAWNRRQDWAILPAADKNESALKIADGKNWGVGDHCYWIDVKTDDSRIIGDGQIVGLEVSPGWGDRINISGIYNYTATGGPLLDEQGRVVGILGGALPASLINSVGSDISTDISEAAYYSTGGTSVAASLLPQSVGSAATSLKDLWAKGEMMPVVTDTRYVLFGMLIQGAKDGSKKRAPVPGERELKVAFRKGDTSANAIIHFNAPENLKSRSVIKLYDVDNHPVGTGKVEKLNLSRGESLERSWQLPLSTLTPGIYRVDILIGDSVAWRQYFKLTD